MTRMATREKHSAMVKCRVIFELYNEQLCVKNLTREYTDRPQASTWPEKHATRLKHTRTMVGCIVINIPPCFIIIFRRETPMMIKIIVEIVTKGTDTWSIRTSSSPFTPWLRSP